MPVSTIILYGGFFLLFFAFILMASSTDRLWKVPFFSLFVLLTVFAGIRYGCGRDFGMYHSIFEAGAKSENLKVQENIWQWLVPLLRDLGLKPTGFFLLISGATYALFFYGFHRLCGNRRYIAVLSFVVIYAGYFETFNNLRQYVAMGIILAAYHYVPERKYSRFLLAVLAATAFHSSAIFILPVVMVGVRKWNRGALFFTLLASLLFGYMLLTPLLDLMAEILPARYAFYAKGDYVYSLSSRSNLYPLFLNIVGLYFIFSKARLQRACPVIYQYINYVVLSICIFNVFTNFEIGARLFYYPFIFIFVLFALAIKKEPQRIYRFVLPLFLTIFFTFMLRSITNPEEPYARYRTIFNPYIDWKMNI